MILHNWADEEAKKILVNTACAMLKELSRLFINEIVLPDIGCPVFPAVMDLHMMSVHTGVERTESQWRELLDSAGLTVRKVWPAPGAGEAIIEAVLQN